MYLPEKVDDYNPFGEGFFSSSLAFHCLFDDKPLVEIEEYTDEMADQESHYNTHENHC